MQISKDCNLVLSDLYLYDFKSCYYNILKSINWDLTSIEEMDKKTRNIQIGYMQRENTKLANYLTTTTEGLVDFYIKLNNLKDTEIISRQKDGLIITKKLTIQDQTMPIDLREVISKLIISVDRKKFLTITLEGVVEVKGIRNKTINTDFYKLFRNLDFSRKKSVLVGLESIRKNILKSNNILYFTRETDDMYFVPIKNEGDLKINKSSLSFIDINDIDKNQIWSELIWPFAESLLIHYQSN